MKLFLDTANVVDLRRWAVTGLIDGVTTNPTHLSEAGGKPLTVVKEICEILPEGEISVEVTEQDPQKLYEQAHQIANIAENVIVKVPCALQYYEVICKLVGDGIPLNITLVFSAAQALLMAKLGVTYISPFIGRLDDSGVDGLEVFATIREALDEYDFESELLAASIRSVDHFEQAAVIGADAVTVPLHILEHATHHPLTEKGIELFEADWKKLGITKFP
jgi:transaldolase